MTTVERLIRNICEDRRLQIVQYQRNFINAVPSSVAWDKVPKPVKCSVMILLRWMPVVTEARAYIQKAGYTLDTERGTVPLRLSRYYKAQEDEKRKAVHEFEQRIAKIAALRHQYTVATLGMTGKDGAKLLAILQAELKEI